MIFDDAKYVVSANQAASFVVQRKLRKGFRPYTCWQLVDPLPFIDRDDLTQYIVPSIWRITRVKKYSQRYESVSAMCEHI